MVNYSGTSFDDYILEVFEENEDHFFFPLTSQKTARAFAKAIHNKGFPYEEMCKEISELEHNFSAWRKGLGRIGIGKRILERFNQPLQQLLDEEEDVDYAALVKAVNGRKTAAASGNIQPQASETSSRVPPTPSETEHSGAGAATGGVAARIKNLEERRRQSSVGDRSSSGDETGSGGRSRSGSEGRSNGCQTRVVEVNNKDSCSSTDQDTARSRSGSSSSAGKTGGGGAFGDVHLRHVERQHRPEEQEEEEEEQGGGVFADVQLKHIDDKKEEKKEADVNKDESREERLAKIQDRIAQLKKKFPKPDPQAAGDTADMKPAPTATTNKKIVEDEVDVKEVETASRNVSIKEKVDVVEVTESYDSDFEEDEFSQVVAEIRRLKMSVHDGPGFVYVFSDGGKSSQASRVKVKVGQTRDVDAKLEQCRLFNPDMAEVCRVSVMARRAALDAVGRELAPAAAGGAPEGWYEGTSNSSVEDTVARVCEAFCQQVTFSHC